MTRQKTRVWLSLLNFMAVPSDYVHVALPSKLQLLISHFLFLHRRLRMRRIQCTSLCKGVTLFSEGILFCRVSIFTTGSSWEQCRLVWNQKLSVQKTTSLSVLSLLPSAITVTTKMKIKKSTFRSDFEEKKAHSICSILNIQQDLFFFIIEQARKYAHKVYF